MFLRSASVPDLHPLSSQLVLAEVVRPAVGEDGDGRERVLLDVFERGAHLPAERGPSHAGYERVTGRRYCTERTPRNGPEPSGAPSAAPLLPALL